MRSQPGSEVPYIPVGKPLRGPGAPVITKSYSTEITPPPPTRKNTPGSPHAVTPKQSSPSNGLPAPLSSIPSPLSNSAQRYEAGTPPSPPAVPAATPVYTKDYTLPPSPQQKSTPFLPPATHSFYTNAQNPYAAPPSPHNL